MTDYGFAHGGRVFTPNGTDVELAECDARNLAIEAGELAQWANKPGAIVAYVDGARVTTWMGAELGTVTKRTIFRNNFGGRTECLTVRATNGAIYSGRKSADWSQAVCLRKRK